MSRTAEPVFKTAVALIPCVAALVDEELITCAALSVDEELLIWAAAAVPEAAPVNMWPRGTSSGDIDCILISSNGSTGNLAQKMLSKFKTLNINYIHESSTNKNNI